MSKNYGTEGNRIVRVVDQNRSIIFAQYDYSTNGGISFFGLAQNHPLSVQNGYMYAPNVAIVSDNRIGEAKLFIGELGGDFYSLRCPATNVTTLFYSPTTRLIIAGNSEGLYTAILPVPTQSQPELSIEKAVIVSWNPSVGNFVLEGSVSPEGPWDIVLSPVNIVGGEARVAVSASSGMEYFRLRAE